MSAKRSEISISFDNSFYDATPEDNDQELQCQQTQKYIASKKEIYNAVLDYLESSEWSDEYFYDFNHRCTTTRKSSRRI